VLYYRGARGLTQEQLAQKAGLIPSTIVRIAKSASTWDALFELVLFEHNWLRPHPALSQPGSSVPGRYYERPTPAMAIGLADRRCSWQEFLTTKKLLSALKGVTPKIRVVANSEVR